MFGHYLYISECVPIYFVRKAEELVTVDSTRQENRDRSCLRTAAETERQAGKGKGG
jgi:hypothetical protein